MSRKGKSINLLQKAEEKFKLSKLFKRFKDNAVCYFVFKRPNGKRLRKSLLQKSEKQNRLQHKQDCKTLIEIESIISLLISM